MRQTKFHASLNRENMLAGVGTEIFAIEMLGLTVCVILQAYLLILVIPPFHSFMRWLHKRDPISMKSYVQYSKQADHYDPWIHSRAQLSRPKGFGQGLHL